MREDTHSLRLTSELVDLRSGYANPVHCGFAASTVVRILYSTAKGKKNRPSDDGLAGNRGIRLRRRFFALPLTSELDALCGSNANPVHCGFAASTVVRDSLFHCQGKEKQTIG